MKVRLDRLVGHSVREPEIPQHLLKMLAADIRACGLYNPPIVRRLPRTGFWWFLKARNYQIVDGFGRIAACRYLGWKTIPVHVVP